MCVLSQTVHQKGSHGGAGMQPLPKPDVVFASYEAVIADQGALSAMSWETVLLDLRHKYVPSNPIPTPHTRTGTFTQLCRAVSGQEAILLVSCVCVSCTQVS